MGDVANGTGLLVLVGVLTFHSSIFFRLRQFAERTQDLYQLSRSHQQVKRCLGRKDKTISHIYRKIGLGTGLDFLESRSCLH